MLKLICISKSSRQSTWTTNVHKAISPLTCPRSAADVRWEYKKLTSTNAKAEREEDTKSARPFHRLIPPNEERNSDEDFTERWIYEVSRFKGDSTQSRS